MNRTPSRAAALLLASIAVVATHAGAAPSTPEQVGRWLGPFSEDGDGDGEGDFDAVPPQSPEASARLPVAVNEAVLPDGRILYWSQLEGTESIDGSIAFQQPAGARSRSRILDLSSYFERGETPRPASFVVPSPEHVPGSDMVGSEQRHLADGRVLAIGGTEWSNEDAGTGLPGGIGRTELYGTDDARIFDPATGTWGLAAPMHRARYYPSMVTLPDGRLLVASGADRLIYDSSLFPGPRPPAEPYPSLVHESEIFDPAAGSWLLMPDGDAALPPFAHLHLMPDGSVTYPGAGMFFPPGGADRDAGAWDHHHTFDPARGSWAVGDRIPSGARSNAFSALMPLQPPYSEASILVGGGTTGPWPGTLLGTNITEMVTWQDGELSRRLTGAMNAGRWHSSAVVLPTGEVIALSGADRDEVVDPGSGIPIRHAEQFDPRAGCWRQLAEARRGRTLHNTAVLLRDGSILVGGHSPAPAHYGSHRQNPAPFSSNFKDPSFEIFQPPALFRGPRPTIAGISAQHIPNGGHLTISSARAHDPTLRIVLSRLPATTHVIDNDQRTVVLEHVTNDDGISVRIPQPSVAPPGYYYLFLVADNGRGPTPSVAEIVRIG